VKKQNVELKAQNEEILNCYVELKGQIAEILNYTRLLAISPAASPSKKRKLSVIEEEETDFQPEKQQEDQKQLPATTTSSSTSSSSSSHSSQNNALKLLTPYSSESYIELSGLELFECLKRAIKHRWFLSRNVPVKADDRKVRHKILKVLDFVRNEVITEDELNVWVKAVPPQRSDASFSEWEQNFLKFCKELEKRAFQILQDQESTSGIPPVKKKGTNSKVSFICSRLEGLQKKKSKVSLRTKI
jgi:hypothetical protein